MKPLIRLAVKEDAEDLLRLIKGLAAYEKAHEQVVLKAEDLVRDGFGAEPKFLCYVAERDQRIVGMALFYLRYSTWKGPVVHLEDLMVEKDHRSQGIGSALYQAVLSFAREKKVRRVNWEVLDWNSPAIEFYEKSGAEVLKEWRVVSMSDQVLNEYLDR